MMNDKITRIVLMGFGIVVIGAAAAPAVIAFWINEWRLLLLYPIVLTGIILTSLLFGKKTQ